MPNKPKLVFGGDQPCYNAATDTVKLPNINSFASESEYYSAMFHELSHSTGHATRLNRETLTEPAFYASEIYCLEEPVAEIASCFICNEARIVDKTIDNSASYIEFWRDSLEKILEEDKKFFIKASSVAQKAADYILNRIEEMVNSSTVEEGGVDPLSFSDNPKIRQ